MIPTKLFQDFFKSEKAGGLLLIICTLISVMLANSPWGNGYQHFWHNKLGGLSIEHWINDGLMAIFFLLIGLELERELYQGELSSLRDALLPAMAAVGGILVPAAIYLLFNYNTSTQSGAGIPMATDIAFALGVLSLLGKRVPVSMKVFLTALAVIDDLGAILIIAFFYTQTIIWSSLLIALGILIALIICNRLGVKRLIIYLPAGVLMWYFMLHSGVHASITGVLLAFTIPFGKGQNNSPSSKLESALHKPVAFLILPLFALANTAISMEGNPLQLIKENYSIGIALGLLLGKPVGIFCFSWLAQKLGWVRLPADIRLSGIAGIGFLGGIGFTMSIFITMLAFDDVTIVNNAKWIILGSSLLAAIIGLLMVKRSLKGTLPVS
jgi:NhaA family Na+:H+ antiporter